MHTTRSNTIETGTSNLSAAESVGNVVIQKKLAAGSVVQNRYEQEAVATVDRLMGICGKELVQRESQYTSITLHIQPKVDGVTESSDSITNQVNETRGSGSPLPRAIQSLMGNRIGADLSDVRINTGKDAAKMSQALNAQAFTVDKDIYFKAYRFTYLIPICFLISVEDTIKLHFLRKRLISIEFDNSKGRVFQNKVAL